ncbi:sugar ABC transporter substrate-binding protein [Paraburkholderia xenovorans]|nr:sugar ABC transporter substrate-binding protein [Paraburkholderia xenovorans]
MLSGLAASVILSACSVAPGMRMTAPPTLPLTSGDAQTPPVDLQVPIVDINTALIRKMRDQVGQPTAVESNKLFAYTSGYTLGVGDVLQITVWDHPELAVAQGMQQTQANVQRSTDPAAGFVIEKDGTVRFPYAGKIAVRGLQVGEAQERIAAALRRVFENPQVTVRVASYRAKEVYVDGQVRSPGAISITDIPMTLYEAITRAGGLADSADQSRMILVRDGVSYQIDLAKMLARGENPSKILMQNGDLLRVVSRDESGVYVMGEVNKPATAYPLRNGALTLSEALAQAGSINSNSADAAQLYVIRSSGGANPEVFHLDARSPVSMILANEFQLQPKDVVYVDGSGLVRFSRVLSLLLPAINAGLTTAIVTK